MRTKTTVQDIADALSLSRTTVSKVLNHSPAVSEATRSLVLAKAKELGYHIWNKPIVSNPQEGVSEVSCFALVMHAIPGGNHMGTVIIPSMDQKLRQEGVSLITCTVSDSDYASMQLPPILYHAQTKAIVCLEMFHPEYSKLLCSLGKPVLFIDACVDFFRLRIEGDLLLMENRNSVSEMLTSIIRKHEVHTMGFIGDSNHCLSFRERFEAFRQTAFQEHVQWEPFSIMDNDRFYGDVLWVKSQLEALEQLPELFFCANDFLAVSTIEALQLMGKRVPEDVMVCGFDGMPSISWPLNQLTTVITPTDRLGAYAANVMLQELLNETPTGSVTYLKTKLNFRESAP